MNEQKIIIEIVKHLPGKHAQETHAGGSAPTGKRIIGPDPSSEIMAQMDAASKMPEGPERDAAWAAIKLGNKPQKTKGQLAKEWISQNKGKIATGAALLGMAGAVAAAPAIKEAYKDWDRRQDYTYKDVKPIPDTIENQIKKMPEAYQASARRVTRRFVGGDYENEEPIVDMKPRGYTIKSRSK